MPSYWAHYTGQAQSDDPELDPSRSRGGIYELELAIDCMDAVFNDRDEVMTVNVANQGSLDGFPDTLVVETLGRCDADGVRPIEMPSLPPHVSGPVEALGYYQQAAADAAWSGTSHEAVQALASHPLVRSINKAERAVHRDGARPTPLPARSSDPRLDSVRGGAARAFRRSLGIGTLRRTSFGLVLVVRRELARRDRCPV